jgi:hypothetical protein
LVVEALDGVRLEVGIPTFFLASLPDGFDWSLSPESSFD